MHYHFSKAIGLLVVVIVQFLFLAPQVVVLGSGKKKTQSTKTCPSEDKMKIQGPSTRVFGSLSVGTTEGSVHGYIPERDVSTNDNFGVRVWKSLRFAKPPVGNLRFASPVPAGRYTENPYYAVNDPPACIQKWRSEIIGEEDCLFLNVYAPNEKPDPKVFPRGYPVYVYFHGGAFIQNGVMYESNVFAKKDTVVVVPAYRLGLLGSLVSPDGVEMTGNQGFLDQQLALQWVQTNIHHFDGDKGHVTIGGQSGGGNYVSLHMSSPSSRGLFHAAIIESSFWIQDYDSFETAKTIGAAVYNNVGCTNLACMHNLDKGQLLIATSFMYFTYNGPGKRTEDHRVFAPYINGSGSNLLPLQPKEAFSTGQIADVPVLAGTVKAEGNLYVFKSPGALVRNPIIGLDNYKAFLAEKWGASSVDELLKLYPFPTADVYNKTDYRYAYAAQLGDFWQYCPLLRVLDSTQSTPAVNTLSILPKNTFVYKFAFYPSTNLFYPEDGGCQHTTCHHDELPFVFMDPVSMMYHKDSSVARAMNSAWRNFIHNYDPNVGVWKEQIPVAYPRYYYGSKSSSSSSSQQEKQMLIDYYPKVVKKWRAKQCAFWADYTPTPRDFLPVPS